MKTKLPDLLTVAEAARALRVSQRTVRRMVDGRSLRHIRVGRKLCFYPEDIQLYLDKHTVLASTDSARAHCELKRRIARASQ